MAAGKMEMVLYYSPGGSELAKHTALMKSVLVRMGVRIRNVGPEQTGESVGFLAGVDGFEAASDCSEAPVIPEQVLVMKNFTSGRIDQLLLGLRRAGVPKIDLKAIVTEHNCSWSFYKLYEELKSEHEVMKKA